MKWKFWWLYIVINAKFPQTLKSKVLHFHLKLFRDFFKLFSTFIFLMFSWNFHLSRCFFPHNLYANLIIFHVIPEISISEHKQWQKCNAWMEKRKSRKLPWKFQHLNFIRNKCILMLLPLNTLIQFLAQFSFGETCKRLAARLAFCLSNWVRKI